MEAEPRSEHLILAGGGHSHALVLRHWAMRPQRRPHALITLVNRCSTAMYSGMVPGVVAGIYRHEQAAIDLRQLCQLADVCFVEAEITGLDLAANLLKLANRPPLHFDWLSLDVGAEIGSGEPADATSPSPATTIAVKPLEPFLRWCQNPAGPPLLQGSGAAAVELALALRARGLAPVLQTKPNGLALGSTAANRKLLRLLLAAGIVCSDRDLRNQAATPSRGATLLCTGSRGPRWLADCGLPTDGRGRVRTDNRLMVVGQSRLLASGDCGVIDGAERPASGVWAVRAAPVLAANLQHALARRPLRRWRPQRHALQLLGDGGVSGSPRAIALWGPLALGPSRWLWHCKDRIDQRFMLRFAELPALMRSSRGTAAAAMACRGCAAKLAAEPLQTALKALDRIGLPSRPRPLSDDDAAVIASTADGRLLLQSVDGFPALVSDPWLNGRLTALHACSDLWACGASVSSAQAVVTLPQVAPALQSDLLLQTLAGVRSVLDPLDAPLLGGHTLETRDTEAAPAALRASPLAGLSLMLTINGTARAGGLWAKGPLRPGDALILTRPLGSGVLFAAAMAGAAKPEWIDQALRAMDQCQASVVDLLTLHGCRACTDITGFGLLGHLGEMLRCTPVQVELQPSALQTLAYPGALELLHAGYASTLAPTNSSALNLLDGPVWLKGPWDAALAQLMVDPQTCGPLLAALPEAAASPALADLHDAGFQQAAVIGHVVELAESQHQP